jgi:hypothetical protein
MSARVPPTDRSKFLWNNLQTHIFVCLRSRTASSTHPRFSFSRLSPPSLLPHCERPVRFHPCPSGPPCPSCSCSCHAPVRARSQYLYAKNVRRVPYPSTLHIRFDVHSAPGAAHIVTGVRPTHALELERGAIDYAQMWKTAQDRYAALPNGDLSGGSADSGNGGSGSGLGLSAASLAERRCA